MSKDINKILSESAGLTEEQAAKINEAWEAKLEEAREEVSSQLREEYAKKYEHDKGVLAEAIDNFVTDRIRVELEEFAEDKKALISERIAYKKKVTEHTKLLDKFITETVAKEVKELRADKVKMSESFTKLENFVLKQLAEEIREFRTDKRELVEQKVKMVSEGKQQLAETKKQFITRAAKVIEENINRVLKAEMSQFKDDIKLARENEFGRRMFEAMVGEYASSFLNEGTEVRKLMQVIESKEAEIEALHGAVTEKATIAESLESKLAVANDRFQRNQVMSGLLAPLSKEKQAVMKDLLESVQTKDLEKQFDKYLPAVLNETAVPKKKAAKTLTENRTLSERTGNRVSDRTLQESIDKESKSELEHIKILAGLK